MPDFVVRFIERIGMPAALVEVLVRPLLAALLLWGLRRLFLWLIAKRYRRPQDLRRWRYITIYVVLVTAGLTFRGIWIGSLEQISIVVASMTQLDAAATLDWLTTSLSVFFSTVALVLAVAVTRTLYRSLRVRVRAWTKHAPAFRIQRLEFLTRQTLPNAAKQLLFAANSRQNAHLLRQRQTIGDTLCPVLSLIVRGTGYQRLRPNRIYTELGLKE